MFLRWPSRRPFYYLRPHAEVAIRHRRSHWGDRDTDEYGSGFPHHDFGCARLELGTVSPGRQFSFTFQTSGTYPYHWSFHPGMTGTVVVMAEAAASRKQQ
jgi:hypothetical protein